LPSNSCFRPACQAPCDSMFTLLLCDYSQ